MSNNVAAKPSRRAIMMLFAANAISFTGNQLAALAIPWFVLATTGSAAQTGITAFFSILPVVISAFFGGTIVDRLGYKQASIVADIASGVTVALVPLLYVAGMLPFWMLLVLVFFGALLDAPGSTARSALIPELAAAANMPLERASSLIQIVERGSRLIGAPLGGLLIAAFGPQQVLWIDAATFAVSAAMVAFAIPALRVERHEASNYLHELREGLQFIRRDRLTLALLVILMITNLLDAAKASVIMPVFAQQAYGSAIALGLIFGISGGGSVVGALIYSAIGHRYSRRWVFICAFIAVSLPMFVLSFLPPLPVVLVAQAITGLASGPLNPILSTLQYERVPVAMRGRVMGAITAGAYVAMPLGVLIAGYFLELVGLRNALLITATCYALTTASMLVNPVLAEMDQKRATMPLEAV